MRAVWGWTAVVVALCAGSAGAVRAQATDSPPQNDGPTAVTPRLTPKPVAVAQTERLPAGAVKLLVEHALSARPSTRDTVRASLALEGAQPEHASETLKVIASEGKLATAEHAQITTQDGVAALELPAEGRAIVSSASAKDVALKTKIVAEQKTLMPWLVVDTKREGDHSLVRSLRPFLKLATAVHWDADKQRHVAQLLFGMDPENESGGFGAELSPPVTARFAVSCESISTPSVQIAEAGPAGYKQLDVECSPAVKNERPEQTIEVFAGQGSLRYPFEIPHRPGPPQLIASASRVLGLGLGETLLTVKAMEEDGSPMHVQQDLPVQLVVSGGTIDVEALTLPRGQTLASAVAHPAGVGQLQIEAVAGGHTSSEVAIDVAWPLLPLGATLVGGTLGGALFVLLPGKRKRRPAQRIAEGAIVGVVVSGVVLVLPSFSALPDALRDSGVGLFVIATLSGFAGTPLVHSALAAVFPAFRKGSERKPGATAAGEG